MGKRAPRDVETDLQWDGRQWIVTLLVNGQAVVDMTLDEWAQLGERAIWSTRRLRAAPPDRTAPATEPPDGGQLAQAAWALLPEHDPSLLSTGYAAPTRLSLSVRPQGSRRAATNHTHGPTPDQTATLVHPVVHRYGN
jgi:hypothetical protein